MYWNEYLWFMGAMLVCMIFSVVASRKVYTSFSKYDKVKCGSGMTGHDTAVRLLQANGVHDISVGRVEGTLSDHFHPVKKIVNLSGSTYDSDSVAAVAVAAHEIGHVMQKQGGYLMYRLRTALVPVVNFGSRLSMPLVLIGLLLNWFVSAANENIGFYVAMLGVILYGGALLFAIVTLPVELNASKRAGEMLLNEGILAPDEMPAAKKVLSAAAMTYLASLLVSLVTFLRLLVQVLTMFGRRNDRR
ncbi:MAG: zinc metallopeptidase [Firmicutes bacterium]|nr:zinc metallopeptidase [Bacillota bacterium]